MIRRWLAFLFYLGAVYASLPFARDISVALGQRELLGLVVTALYLASAAGVVAYIVFSVRLSDVVAFAALALLTLATGAMVLGLEIAEERIHFLEYGVLALLARHALSSHARPWGQYLGAWLLASLAGLGDELIQLALPSRVGDLRDVGINSLAALLAVAADESLHDRLGWRHSRWNKDE